LPRRPNLWREFSMRWRQTLGNAFSKSKNIEYKVDLLALSLWMRASCSAKAMITDLPLLQPYWDWFRRLLDSRYQDLGFFLRFCWVYLGEKWTCMRKGGLGFFEVWGWGQSLLTSRMMGRCLMKIYGLEGKYGKLRSLDEIFVGGGWGFDLDLGKCSWKLVLLCGGLSFRKKADCSTVIQH